MNADGGNGAVRCREAEALLLEADPEELQGEDEGALARHVRRCDACRRRADRILAGERALDDALQEQVAARSADEVLRGVRAALGRGRRRSSIRWHVAIPLAAAMLAALAIWASGPGEEPTPVSPVVRPAWSASSAGAARRAGGTLGAAPTAGAAGRARTMGTAERVGDLRDVEHGLGVQSDGRFALMKTENPAISVVWFY